MWLILQQDDSDDFVIATNRSHSVREFVEKAFSVVGMNIIWEGHGIDEKGVENETGRIRVEIDPYYYRPLDVEDLRGDATKAKRLLGWEARTSFDQLVNLMVEAEIASN